MHLLAETHTPSKLPSALTHMPVLICDDDTLVQDSLRMLLAGCPSVQVFSTIEAAEQSLNRHSGAALVLLDLGFGSETDAGLNALKRFKRLFPDSVFIVYSGQMDFKHLQTAMRYGAFDFVLKSGAFDELLTAIRRASLAHPTLHQKTLVGSSQVMRTLRSTIQKLKKSDEPVIIQGESGTGKELVAQAIAEGRSWTSIDCGAIHETTAESLLFGHEKGAFTGAQTLRKGVFEDAGDGILFFDEIGNMPLTIQIKLLRVLQEKTFTRLGSNTPRPFKARVVCATNQDLQACVESGRFKHDLLWRLEVFQIHTPPLRDRMDDLPELIRVLAPQLTFSQKSMACLMAYPWPGNVRELKNVLAYLMCMAQDSPETRPVELSDLPSKFVVKKDMMESPVTHQDRVEHFENKLILDAFEASGRNVTQTARALHIDRSHLYSKLKRAGLRFE